MYANPGCGSTTKSCSAATRGRQGGTRGALRFWTRQRSSGSGGEVLGLFHKMGLIRKMFRKWVKRGSVLLTSTSIPRRIRRHTRRGSMRSSRCRSRWSSCSFLIPSLAQLKFLSSSLSRSSSRNLCHSHPSPSTAQDHPPSSTTHTLPRRGSSSSSSRSPPSTTPRTSPTLPGTTNRRSRQSTTGKWQARHRTHRQSSPHSPRCGRTQPHRTSNAWREARNFVAWRRRPPR